MSAVIDFSHVATEESDSSLIAQELAGRRAHESRYYWNRHQRHFAVGSAEGSQENAADVSHILKDERGIGLFRQAAGNLAPRVRRAQNGVHVLSRSLSVNVMHAVDEGGKRAVGFKCSEGMDAPKNLAPSNSSVRSPNRQTPSEDPTSPSKANTEFIPIV
ncbi:hypothetical protein [Bifidobacterium sp.]|jgi:hypothetical protein|uniref:hypothetical protein n=1 Tax=Bifidobacterium sp. TaxID=41200 RepID=UPI0025C0FB69|nr:hypothetical protein [Bifidobacterium sp.]MCH4208594.1 hypothetical protein [Bifidobacterium sp.]MCI1224280.1 hypothetical protein [Bifidobacterium sp.]